MLDPNVTRGLFPYLLDRVRFDHTNPSLNSRVFLDSTASTHLSQPALEKLVTALFNYANVHRGEYDASQITTEDFEKAYNVAANLVNASSWREIIFGRNTTEMINLVMRSL